MVVRRIIIGSAAEYEKWVRSKILLWENVCEIVNQCFPKGRRGIQLLGIHGALLFLCAALPFLIPNFSFLIPNFRKAVWGLVRLSINCMEMEAL